MNVNFSGNPVPSIPNAGGADNAVFNQFTNETAKNNNLEKTPAKDVFKTSKNGKTKVNPFRIWFQRLTKEQIAEINSTGKLPDNMKVRPNPVGTGYHTYHNIFNLQNGTKTLPDGYELRQNKLGFTRLVPKDTEGFWLKKKEV